MIHLHHAGISHGNFGVPTFHKPVDESGKLRRSRRETHLAAALLLNKLAFVPSKQMMKNRLLVAINKNINDGSSHTGPFGFQNNLLWSFGFIYFK